MKAVLTHEDDLFSMDKPITKMKVVYTPIYVSVDVRLTIGKTYQVIQTLSEIYPSVKHYYKIHDDKGNIFSYHAENFTELSEYRKNKIEEILKIN